MEILENSFDISDNDENNNEESMQDDNINQEEINKMMSESPENDLNEQEF